MTHEQNARDILDRMGIENAQSFSSGEIIELANKLREIERLRARVSYLEKCLEGRRKLIARAVGWVEEVKCIGEGAEQCKRSFLNELNWAAAPQQEQEGESRE
jgi:hypothetical protein